MTPTEQNLALAGHCFPEFPFVQNGYEWRHLYPSGQTGPVANCHINLNAMHLAREHCIDVEDHKSRARYMNALREIVGRRLEKNKAGVPMVSDYDLVNAESSEHLEALLRTLDLWKA